MANKTEYRGNNLGMTKAPNPPKDQPKSTAVKGNDLRAGCGGNKNNK